MFLVVLGHVILISGNMYGGMNNWLYQHIYSFHMPLFMSLSGFFSANLLDGKGDVMKKFRQIMIPWLLLELSFYVVGVHFCNMWYLICLFSCYVICFSYLCIFRIKCNVQIRLVIAIISCLVVFPILSHSPLRFIKIDHMLPFFVFGMIVKQYIYLINNKYSLAILTFLFILFEFLWKNDFIWYSSFANWFHKTPPYVSFSNLYCSGMRYISGVVGTLFFLSLFNIIGEKLYKVMSKLPNCGKYSLHIYIIQTFIVEIGMKHFNLCFPQGNELLWIWIVSPIISLVICIICVYIAKVLSLNYYIDRYLFGNVKRSKVH